MELGRGQDQVGKMGQVNAFPYEVIYGRRTLGYKITLPIQIGKLTVPRGFFVDVTLRAGELFPTN